MARSRTTKSQPSSHAPSQRHTTHYVSLLRQALPEENSFPSRQSVYMTQYSTPHFPEVDHHEFHMLVRAQIEANVSTARAQRTAANSSDATINVPMQPITSPTQQITAPIQLTTAPMQPIIAPTQPIAAPTNTRPTQPSYPIP